MYIQPRRRTARKKGISLRRIFVWLFAPVIILLAAGAFYMREDLQKIVAPLVNSVARNAVDTVATIAAPTPMPTADPSSNQRLAESAWQNGQFQEAIRLYESVLSALPNDLNAHYYYTLGLIMQGRTADAAKAAENTVTASPFSADAWSIRAMALNRNDRYADAVVSALRAVELQPESARAHAALAESYINLERYTRAEQEIDRALAINPDSFEAHYVKGMYEWNVNGDFGTARLELQNAYDLSKGAAHIGLNLGRLLLFGYEGDSAAKQEGLGLMADILDRNPDNAAVLYWLGYYSWRNEGDTERAETYLRRCVSASPTDISCNYELGRVLLRLEQPTEARQAFERAVTLGSGNPYHYYWAGQVQLDTSGDCSAAIRFFQPGYQIIQNEIAADFSPYASIAAIEALRGDFETAMSPCMGGVLLPTPESTAEPTTEG